MVAREERVHGRGACLTDGLVHGRQRDVARRLQNQRSNASNEFVAADIVLSHADKKIRLRFLCTDAPHVAAVYP